MKSCGKNDVDPKAKSNSRYQGNRDAVKRLSGWQLEYPQKTRATSN
jgi:hypothetical protein